jgi:hypothetical protein
VRNTLSGSRFPGFGDEHQRAVDLCEMTSEWGLRGVIRTETPGFEISIVISQMA